MLTPNQQRQAEEMFALKRPTLMQQIAYRASRRRFSREYTDDWRQAASLLLWRYCQQAVVSGAGHNSVCCELAAKAAGNRMARQRRRDRRRLGERHVVSLDAIRDEAQRRGFRHAAAADPPAREPEILVDGVRFTMADAKLDAPEMMANARPTVGVRTVAGRLGVSTQRVYQVAGKLGGRRVGTRWRFPAATGLAQGTRR